jgi:hypothetical protein
MSISYIHCQYLWPRVIPAPGGWMPAYTGITFSWCGNDETDIEQAWWSVVSINEFFTNH